MTDRRNVYAGSGLDRATERRRDPAWIAARLADPATRVVPLWRGLPLVAEPAPGRPRAAFLGAGETWWQALAPDPPTLLGLLDGIAHFAVDLSALDGPEAHPHLRGRGAFVDLRAVGALLPAAEGGLLATARALLHWHSRHRFCGLCGRPTVSGEAGHVRTCTGPDCGTPTWPRTDPAVIMLVHDGERALLARQPRFPPGMYSTLAGFVEPGESLEDAVAREVLEETGVTVAEVRYHSSQPWPFPASIMLGFIARAATTALTVQRNELEDARWFTRAEIAAARDPAAFHLPRPDSIARRLIADWLAGMG